MRPKIPLDSPERKRPFKRRKKRSNVTLPQRGRPTKYRAEYCQMILTFFNIPSQNAIDLSVTTTKPDGTVVREEKEKLEPTLYPCLVEWCEKIEITEDTHNLWCHEHPDYSDAWKKCKKHQQRILIQNALLQKYDSRFTQFVMINNHGFISANDKVKHEGAVPVREDPRAMETYSDEELEAIVAFEKKHTREN